MQKTRDFGNRHDELAVRRVHDLERFTTHAIEELVQTASLNVRRFFHEMKESGDVVFVICTMTLERELKVTML